MWTMNLFLPSSIAAEVFRCEMCVDLGCRNIGMTEQLLDCPEVCPAVQHMGSETMSERMRGNIGAQISGLCVPLQDLPESLSCQPLPPAIQEKSRFLLIAKEAGADADNVLLQGRQGRHYRDKPFLAAFAETAHTTFVPDDIIGI